MSASASTSQNVHTVNAASMWPKSSCTVYRRRRPPSTDSEARMASTWRDARGSSGSKNPRWIARSIAASSWGSPATCVSAPISSFQQRVSRSSRARSSTDSRARAELGRLERLRDLDRAARARPVHEHREAVQPGLPAKLPETGVRLLEARVHLVDEHLDHVDRRVAGNLPDEACVEEQPRDAEHHLAVDVVLDVLERLVADPHRPVAVVAGEVRRARAPSPRSRR